MSVETAISQTLKKPRKEHSKRKQPAIELVSFEEHAARSKADNFRSGKVPPPGGTLQLGNLHKELSSSQETDTNGSSHKHHHHGHHSSSDKGETTLLSETPESHSAQDPDYHTEGT